MPPASGGPIRRGEPFMVGSDGPELFIPAEPGHIVPPKERAAYRLTRASLVWIIAAILLVPYELLCVARGVDGGPLTHVVKWAYGEPQSARWWLLGFANTGFLAWLLPHFLFEGWGLRSLLTLVALGLLVGLAGYLATR